MFVAFDWRRAMPRKYPHAPCDRGVQPSARGAAPQMAG